MWTPSLRCWVRPRWTASRDLEHQVRLQGPAAGRGVGRAGRTDDYFGGPVTITGIPGLSLIPLLRSNTVTKDDGQTLIVLKPRIQILPPTEFPTFRAWSGTETKWAASF